MFANLAIHRKIAMSFAALIAVFLMVSIAVFINVAQLGQVSEHRDQARLVSERSDDMMAGVVEAQSAVRGYVLLGKPEFLATYDENKAKIADAVADARRHTSSPEQRGLFGDFIDAAGEWQATKVAKTIELYRDPATRTEAIVLAGTKQLGAMRKIKKSIDETQDAVVAALDADHLSAERTLTAVLVVGALLAVAVAGVLGWPLSRTVASPAGTLSRLMDTLANGRTDIDVPFASRGDEIGSMAKALLVFREAAVVKARADEDLQRVMEEVGAGLARIANADLGARFADFPPTYRRVEDDFNRAMDAMAGTMGRVADATRGINSGAADIRHASDDLSQRTEQQAASLEETAAAMDEITSTVRETAAGAVRADQVVGETRVEAENSGDVVARAVVAMSGIERSSTETPRSSR